MEQSDRLNYLIDYLIEENPNESTIDNRARTIDEKITLFRSLCNVRQPLPVSDTFIQIQNDFLREWNNKRGMVYLTDITPLSPQLYLWQGDITQLAVGAIVNAANSELLGCMIPNHTCIDNIIHTRAGVQLRLACHDLINEQGRKEAVGKAKITDAYNLPAKYVLHTVGPFIDDGSVSKIKENLLASSYRSCLSLAEKQGIKSIAFCCISTGEFNFPNDRAAEIAIHTVKKYLLEHDSNMKVIFNVFKDEDAKIYDHLLT